MLAVLTGARVASDFDFTQPPRAALVLDPNPSPGPAPKP